MVDQMSDYLSKVPAGTRWCRHCNGYGSSLKETSSAARAAAGPAWSQSPGSASRGRTGTSRVGSDTRSRTEADRAGGPGYASGAPVCLLPHGPVGFVVDERVERLRVVTALWPIRSRAVVAPG
jgi:hypothetical protein